MYCLRHKHKKGRYVSRRGDFCGLQTDEIMWHDAYVTVSEAELKRPDVESVSAIQIIKELQAEKEKFLQSQIIGSGSLDPEHAVEEQGAPYGD